MRRPGFSPLADKDEPVSVGMGRWCQTVKDFASEVQSEDHGREVARVRPQAAPDSMEDPRVHVASSHARTKGDGSTHTAVHRDSARRRSG